MVGFAPCRHDCVLHEFIKLVYRRVEAPESVGVAKILVKVVHVQVAGNESGVIMGVIVGFFHEGKASIAHLEHTMPFLRGQGQGIGRKRRLHSLNLGVHLRQGGYRYGIFVKSFCITATPFQAA